MNYETLTQEELETYRRLSSIVDKKGTSALNTDELIEYFRLLHVVHALTGVGDIVYDQVSHSKLARQQASLDYGPYRHRKND